MLWMESQIGHLHPLTDTKMLNLNQSCSTVKESVREKYDAIARGELDCGCKMVDEFAYKDTPGYQSQADLGLGCGTPVDYAELKPGETVLDLGSGAGLDAMIAAPLVGERGNVLGVDLAPSMVVKAKENAIAVGVENTFFQEGDIEALPLQDHSVDVVISNCTLNLVPDKEKAYSEIARVLRPGGRFIISDVVVVGNPDPELLQKAEEAAGCVAGAAEKESYLELISRSGFTELEIVRFQPLNILAMQDGLASLTIRAWRQS